MQDADDAPMQAPPDDGEDSPPGLLAARRARRAALTSAKVIPIKPPREPDGGGPGGGGGGQSAPEPDFDPTDNLGNADELLRAKYTFGGYVTLLNQSGLLHWRPGHGWRDLPDGQLDVAIYPHFDGRTVFDRKGNAHSFHVGDRMASNVQRALRARLHSAEKLYPPCYIPASDPEAALRQKSWPPAERLIGVANGLLDYETLQLLPATPAYFSYGGSPIVFDEFAECPNWYKFNVEIFGGDAEMIQAAQEFAGLCLSDIVSFQKIGFLMGPTRSGKSLWAKIIEKVIGTENVIGPSLASLDANFPLEPFIRKKLAVFGDARVPDKKDRKVILDSILTISGGDTLTVARKYNPEPWSGRLPTRLLFISNELPELNDTSLSLPARIILLQTKQSFLGSEDVGLESVLSAELPGVLNWCLAGLRRLMARGRFVQPTSSADAMKALRDLSSPMASFLADCCKIGPAEMVEAVQLYNVRKVWDQQQGADRRISHPQFGKQVRAAVPGLKVHQPREGASRPRYYVGVALTDYGFSLLDPGNRLI